MKFTLIFLILFSVYHASGSIFESNWKNRMEKYGGLVKCQYYLTSDDSYGDSFQVNTKKTYFNSIGIRFFALTYSRSAIKFVLTDKEKSESYRRKSNKSSYKTTESYYFYGFGAGTTPLDTTNDYYYTTTPRYDPTTPRYTSTTRYTTTVVPYSTTTPSNNNDGYELEFAIGEKSDTYNGRRSKRSYSQDPPPYGGSYPVQMPYLTPAYIETYINKNGQRIKTLTTPEIVRQYEPNEIVVEIFGDGKILITINDVLTIETKVDEVSDVNYIRFGSAKRELIEYFYNCSE